MCTNSILSAFQTQIQILIYFSWRAGGVYALWIENLAAKVLARIKKRAKKEPKRRVGFGFAVTVR